MSHHFTAMRKTSLWRLVVNAALQILFLGLAWTPAHAACDFSRVTITRDTSGTVITIDHPLVQCDSAPESITLDVFCFTPGFTFTGVTYVSGPANIVVNGATAAPGALIAQAFSVVLAGVTFNSSGEYTFQGFGINGPAAAPQTLTVRVCSANPVTAVTAVTNENCDPQVNPNCTPNIVQGDATDSTVATVTVQPAQKVFVHMSTDFGSINDVTTDSTGKAFSTFTSGSIPFGTTATTRANVSAKVCGAPFPNIARIMNYHGFEFHQSQVSDAAFVDSAALDANAIQQFLANHGSFLANFILVARIGGFIDLNGNGVLDPGEPTYSATGAPIPPRAPGTSAAALIASAARLRGLNPKVLLATAEKENSLISSQVLPPTAVLNFALGCGRSSNFVDQVECAARTFVRRFNDHAAFGRTISYPFFFHASDGIQHNDGTGRKPVGFQVQTAATYAQYRYTPFIQSLPNGGGVYLFETIWRRFGF